MKENEFKSTAKKFLEEKGLMVYDISPKEGCKTPDFNVTGRNSNYTIELKIKSDNPEEIKKDLEILSQGEILSKFTPVGPRNTLSAIVKEGVEQMEEHDPENKTYHILWIHSAGQDPDLLNRRFRATLFGTETLFSIKRTGIMICYYFNESSFYRYRTLLDGAILTYNDKLQLCVNTLSPRKDKFRQSDLYRGLSKGLFDPDIFQQEEGIMIANCDINRKNMTEVVKYLQNKHGLSHLQIIPMTQDSAKIAMTGKYLQEFRGHPPEADRR